MDVCPESLKNLITVCWDAAPDVRPTSAQVLEKLKEIKNEYESNSAEWDILIGSLEQASSGPQQSSSAPSPASQPKITTSVTEPLVCKKEETPETEPKSTKWSHKTIDDFLQANNQSPEIVMRANTGSGTKDKARRSSLTRAASKKILAKMKTEEKVNNGANEQSSNKIEIEVAPGNWTNTMGNWRDEDDFGDDGDGKKKKGWGIKKMLGFSTSKKKR